MNGVAVNGTKAAKRGTRNSVSRSVDLDADDGNVLVSPAVLMQMEHQNSLPATTRSRHKKSKSKAARDLAVNINAASARIVNVNGVADKVKARVIDWEIPRKALHSSIGTYPFINRQT